ncbi:MAG: hypothetical protein OQJ84_07890 [Xanthomonadales bacterium]|nr:hypothetical protein [Xanthomonadales bacterium]
MEGKVTISVLQESHEGSAGNDWKYQLEVKVFNRGLQGQGVIEVAKHNLPSGTTQAPPGPPAPVEIPIGDSSNDIKVKFRLEAHEVDLFRNDVGVTDIDLNLACPQPGEEPLVLERDISVGVSDSGRDSVVTLGIRLVLSCD